MKNFSKMDQRKYNEQQYHNEVFNRDIRAKARKYYAISQINEEFYYTFLACRCAGKNVLEYGCGLGKTAFFLSLHSATVTSIDISDVAVQKAVNEANRLGIKSVTFQVMDAEAASYPDKQFDIICGNGILHHLNLKNVYAEISRLLKPDGFTIFTEPLKHNPIIKLYRKFTPHLRTQEEHPLSLDDLKIMAEYFDNVELHYFHICTLLAVPFRRFGIFFAAALRILRLLDCLLFTIPFLRKYAWMVIIIASKPKSAADSHSDKI